MTVLRFGTTTWLTGLERVRPLDRSQRRVVTLWARTALVMAVAASLGFTTMASAPRADQARAVPAPGTGGSKDPARVGARDAELGTAAAAAVDPLSPAGLFLPGSMAGAAAFPGGGRPLAADAFASQGGGQAERAWTAANPPAQDWRQDDFTRVTVIDGRTLAAGGLRIRLLGLDLPLPEQMCRTLDGRLEPCAERAATQLELLTRWRTVTCHYRVEAAGQAVGRCRLGRSDLTDRMIKTGYAWPSAGMPRRSAS